MKISELNQKTFLGTEGALDNSYVLINYGENAGDDPVTYTASVKELGKAIANELHLYQDTSTGAVTTDVSSGAYVNNEPKQLVYVDPFTVGTLKYVNTYGSVTEIPVTQNVISEGYNDVDSNISGKFVFCDIYDSGFPFYYADVEDGDLISLQEQLGQALMLTNILSQYKVAFVDDSGNLCAYDALQEEIVPITPSN